MIRSIVVFAAVTLAIATLPFFASNYVVRLGTFMCMYASLALAWNLIGGYAGYPSFATAAFVGLGSYVGGLIQNAGLPVPLPWLAALVAVALFAAALGFAILRMKGHYFAIGSIAIVEILRLVTSSWISLTNGANGLTLRMLRGGPAYAGRVFLYSMMAAMIVAFITTLLVDRSRLGFGLRCINQNEDAADMVGVNVTAYKIAAFSLSAALCGLVGAIYASWVAYIDPGNSFDILLTLKIPVMALLGGIGTVLGPALGAWIFVMLDEFIWARFLELNRAILGIVVVVLIFGFPGGLLRLPWRPLWLPSWRSLRRSVP